MPQKHYASAGRRNLRSSFVTPEGDSVSLVGEERFASLTVVLSPHVDRPTAKDRANIAFQLAGACRRLGLKLTNPEADVWVASGPEEFLTELLRPGEPWYMVSRSARGTDGGRVTHSAMSVPRPFARVQGTGAGDRPKIRPVVKSDCSEVPYAMGMKPESGPIGNIGAVCAVPKTRLPSTIVRPVVDRGHEPIPQSRCRCCRCGGISRQRGREICC